MERSLGASRQSGASRPGEVPLVAPASVPSEEDYDWAFIGLAVLFVVHSIRRHPAALLAIWFGVFGLTVTVVAVLPKVYEVQTTLQAQPTPMISALGGGTPSAADTDAPAKQAAQTVLRRDNLVALIRQTDLIHNWPKNRAPLMRLKDVVWGHLFQPPSEQTQVENFVGLLGQRLWVTTGAGTVTIGIHFPDAQLAYHLVEAAVLDFLEARHATEISSIADVIFVLQSRAAQARQTVEEAQRELQQLREVRAANLGRQRHARAPRRSPAAPDAETSELLVKIAGKRRALEDLENFRRRSVDQMESRAAELRALYSSTHPLVLDTEQSLKALNQESPQVAALGKEISDLEEELKSRGKDPGAPQLMPESFLETALQDPLDPREDQDPDIDHAKQELRQVVDRYNAILDRVQSAQLQEDTAQAAFKYRYVVIWPAQRPRGPIQPKPELVFPASLVAGLLLAIIAVTLRDLSSRRVLESWQVERAVGVPLLAEIRLP
jgi:hypothetical protein